MRALAALILVTSLSGCGPTFRNCRADSEVPGLVRVSFTKLDDDVFQFVVVNYSQSMLVIYRDRVQLVGPRGVQNRLPGGFSSVYNVAPGRVRKVNVKFRMDGIERGQEFAISFAQAIDVGPSNYGQPAGHIVVEPIPFIAQ